MEKIVAGNWKMHHGPAETRAFLEEFSPPDDGALTIVFPPSVSIAAARAVLGEGGAVGIGVQNVHWQERGAFTGEISAAMARECGVEYALVGHSERRQLFHETDEVVRRKVGSVLRAGLKAMACVGETLEERDEGRLEEVLLRQVDAVLQGAGESASEGGLLLAYEPVWAIGTGRTATPADASHAHGILRERLVEELGESSARSVPILYGGSVKPENAQELMSAAEVDGVLVGGASLQPESFRAIAAAA